MQRHHSNRSALVGGGILLVLAICIAFWAAGRFTPNATDLTKQTDVHPPLAAAAGPDMTNDQVVEKPRDALRATETRKSTAAPEPAKVTREAKAKDGSNIRGGPGTNYPIVATVNAGDRLVVSGKTQAGDWYELHDGGWILAQLADVPDASALPIATYRPGNYNGLGRSRVALQEVYAAAPFNVFFASGADVDGQPQILGRTANGLAIVQLIGPAPDLTEASVTVIGSKDDLGKNATNIAAMVKLLEIVVPDWSSPGAWVASNMQAALDQGGVSTVRGKYLVSLTASKELGTLVVIVKAAK